MKTNDELLGDLVKLSEKYYNSRFLNLYDICSEELKEFNLKEDDFITIEEGDWTQDSKYQYREDIYQYVPTGQYICVCNSRSGSPFTDWYYSDPHICLVNKVEKTVVVTTWEVIK